MLDQLTRHANQLKELYIEEYVPQADKVNVADLAARILEAQEEIHMEKLTLFMIGSKTDDEPVAEDRRLINALLYSGITKLI